MYLKLHMMVQLIWKRCAKATPTGVPQVVYKDVQERTLEVEIMSTSEVTIKLHLKMHIMVHILVYKSVKNNSIKRWTCGGTLCCTWEHT